MIGLMIALLGAAARNTTDCPITSRYIYDEDGKNISDVFHTDSSIVDQHSKADAEAGGLTEFGGSYEHCSTANVRCLRFGVVDILVPESELPGTLQVGGLECALKDLPPGKLQGSCRHGEVMYTYTYERRRGLTEYTISLPRPVHTYRLRGQCGLLTQPAKVRFSPKS